MTQSNPTNQSASALSANPILLPLISLAAIVGVFVLVNAAPDYDTKFEGFSLIIFSYLSICFGLHYFVGRISFGTGSTANGKDIYPDLDAKLFAIEEAHEYFAGSLKSADMFRLLSNKVNEIVPFTAIVLLVADQLSGRVKAVHAHGENAEQLRGVESDINAGVAGRSYETKMVQIDRGKLANGEANPANGLAGFRSAAAIPLIRSGEVFALLQVYSNSRTAFDGNSIELLEAVGERVSPLILSSLSFERTVNNALTDPVTGLPNERAFQLILENQIAETQRNPDFRPLTVVAIDIKGFDEMNSKYGHAAGDRFLGMIAHAVRGQLRQMDFFARASNDEFLAILPTAIEDVAEDVIGRIRTGLFSTRFFVTEHETIRPELNFGIASFGRHGETAEALVRTARLRKQQAKADAPRQVLWFPKDLVN
jgi:diguanylate cyclase (GGDEF)-like protein